MTSSEPEAPPLWQRLSLATRFALVSGVVFVFATLLIGSFIVDRIEQSVVRNSANATAHFMDSVLSPVSGQLAENGTLSPGARRALDEIFENSTLGDRVASYKIWGPGGLVIAATDKSIEGQVFTPTQNLTDAFKGAVTADFEELSDDEDAGEAALGLPLLEIYTPIHEAWSGRTAAVAEFYEINDQLRADLDSARRSTWATVSGVSLGLGAILYMIVLGGSRTIDRQRAALDARLAELRDLSARNTELRLRVQRAAGRAAAGQEKTMRRLGADLHDGPAQDLAYAALRLDSLSGRVRDPNTSDEIKVIKGAVDNALSEVRGLSRGMSLPQIAALDLPDIINRVIDADRLRRDNKVQLDLKGDMSFPLSEALRICVFRFAQEGLTNAARHAPGSDVRVSLENSAGHLRLAIEDRGPGLPDSLPEPEQVTGHGLGLVGLRDRVESLGGSFRIENRPGGGTLLEMTLDTGT